ncbi:TPA: hypothetical protein DEP96_00180 [Candidatus Uhrbacteria bacterium]|nr:hypothetical protein [Candidatus Uhrbacteria bacterium]
MKKKFLVIAALIVYFCSTLWLTIGVPASFTSPDENANYSFSESMLRTGSLAVYDDVTAQLGGLVHPRSALVVGEFIVPGSFLGLAFTAGLFGHLVGVFGLRLLTPILLVLALLAWFSTVKKLTKNEIFASVATVLLALQPAVWYYATRTMMPNVGFVCFLIFAAWLVVVRPLRRAWLEFLLAGLCLGLAAFFRLSELVWIMPSVLAVAIIYRRAVVGKLPWLMLILGFVLPLALNVSLNSALYKQPLSTGYTVVESVDLVESADSVVSVPKEPVRRSVLSLLLPFGVHPRVMAKNIWHYGLGLFWWLSILAAIGLYFSLREKGGWRKLAIGTLILAAWLGTLYGSWSFNDNPDPSAITIGDSHLRYWLPLFVLATLFATKGLLGFRKTPSISPMAGGGLLVIALLSSLLVFSGEDGLVETRQVLLESATKREIILAETEANAIVVVDRADKFLWPYRHVIQPLRSESTYAAMPEAVKLAPLYYFGIPFPEVDLHYLNEEKLGGMGLRIELVKEAGDEALYRILAK